MKNCAEQTNYPQLFKETYWGCTTESEADIIDNRNSMVEKFNILDYHHHKDSAMIGKKYARERNLGYCLQHVQLKYSDGFDHLEFYRIRGESKKFIMFTSDYNRHDMSKLGFEKTIPIYHKNATTWFRIFENNQEYRQFVRNNGR